MKKRLAASATILVALLGICLYRGADHVARSKETSTASKRTSSPSTANQNTETTALPTKVSDRPAGPIAHATHRPDQLKQFYLPDVNIDGLPLKDALAKLRTAYEDVCRESGEVPLTLTFVVPPEATKPLTAKTGISHLDGAIHLLAAMSGLKVSRTGSEYTFTAPEETGEFVKKAFTVPPDFLSRASDDKTDPFEEGKPSPQLSPAEFFASKGLTLDPSTKLSFSGMTLQLETTSAADRIAINGLIDATNNAPIQHKMETRMVNISAGANWTPPDVSQLDQAGMTQLMRQLEQSKDAQILIQPAITARTGENAKVEIIREMLVPSQTEPGGFETQAAGVIVDFRTSPYGFGHHVDLNYSERTAEGESGTATAKVNERTAIADSSFSSDGNARMHVQTHPDGSRSVVLVTPTLIDATGRPLHSQE